MVRNWIFIINVSVLDINVQNLNLKIHCIFSAKNRSELLIKIELLL